MRRNWQDAPDLTIPVYEPLCPGCGSADWLHIRGLENGDASSTELAVCGSCSLPFKIIRERFPVRESIEPNTR